MKTILLLWYNKKRKEERMEIINLKLGMLKTNCYILKEGNETLIIDPADEYFKIDEIIKNTDLKGILITHNHFDHIGALNQLLKNYQTKTYDKNNLEEKTYQIGNFSFEVIYTPGHTADSITFYFPKEKAMFVGDFIFKDDIGRCDLPTGDYLQMLASINKIKKDNDDILIYPGHEETTTLLEEKKFNEYFKYN